MPVPPKRLIQIGTLLILALLLATPALAQAGGGGSYSGGGGDGGGSGGGDGLFYLFYFLIRLAIDAPIIGVPLLIIAIVVVVVMGKSGNSARKTRSIRRGRPMRQQHRSGELASRLREFDPEFNTAAFVKRVRSAFDQAQDAWCKQNLKPIRSFVSDGVYERFSLQIEEQQRDGWRQGMDHTTVQSCSLIHVDSDEHFDTITVRIAFRSTIYRLDAKTGEKISGSTLPHTEFVECWSFLRRRGAKTGAENQKGLIEGHCPNCGAPLELNQAEECSACGSLVLSGQHDWVLVEITQASEWRGEDTAHVPGLANLRPRDPDLSVQHIEDRVSVMFWRKVAADRDGNSKPLTKVATAELLDSYAKQLGRGEDGMRTFLGDCAVGSVKTLAFLKDEDRDRAVVEVRWDGVRMTERPGKELERGKERALRRTIFELTRDADAKSNISHALQSNHCAACGAPDDGGTSDACSFCGAPLTDGSNDWALIGIHAFASGDGVRLMNEVRGIKNRGAAASASPAAPASTDALGWALQGALADGHIDETESKVLHDMAKKLDVPTVQLSALLTEVQSGRTEFATPDSPAEARQWLLALIETMLEDGKISSPEQRMLQSVGQQAGWSTADLAILTQRAKADIYRETREARRAATSA